MRIKSLLLAIGLVFCGSLQPVWAQCEYRLEMFDSFGDGWNGGLLTIVSGNTTQVITLNNFPSDGMDSTVYLLFNHGDPLTLSWAPGSFNSEISFSLYSTAGLLVYNTTNPQTGLLFEGEVICPACVEPTGVVFDNIYDTRYKLRWQPGVSSSNPVGWWVITVPKDSVPGLGIGDTLYVTTPKATVTGLEKKTFYDVYVRQDCGNGEFSSLNGPYTFQTYWSNDVGVFQVVTPVNSCSLGVEKVSVVLKNYGANPQSLLPFNYSVNGVPAGVPQPEDGFYTGVLGKDSCETVEFETMFDFSAPGEYLIKVWTEMEGDEDVANDTLVYRVVNRLVAPYEQDFEAWNGGWYVDTALSNLPSWTHGQPDKFDIPAAASGQNAWVTNLTTPYNFGEKSYLNSPCFDFTDLTEDPVIEFALIYSTDPFSDGGFLEVSTNGGQSWEKVGAIDEGLNWYNTFTGNFGEAWAGQSGGWVKARHRIFGVAGESEVRLRFVFNGNNPFNAYGGMGVDDIQVYVPLARDLVGLSVTTLGDAEECGLEEDEVTLTYSNFGTEPQSLYQVGYSVNGGPAVLETVVAGSLLPDEIDTYTFNANFDSRDSIFEIKVWTNLTDEMAPDNDTVTYIVDHRPRAAPYLENFESMQFPADWTIQSLNAQVTNAHNNVSYVLASNIYSSNPNLTYTLPRFGPIEDGDSLQFSYRITNWPDGLSPTVLTNGTKFEVQVSTDCGETFTTIYTIGSSTHLPTIVLRTIKLSLTPYAGESVKIRFLGTWGAGDFWFDLDNVNIRSCPESMALTASITSPTGGLDNGTATVEVGSGNPPYQYAWSSGATTQTATGLPLGEVTVTVTDSKGCSDVLTVDITLTSTADIDGLSQLSVFPNPTTGQATLTVAMERPADLTIEIVDMMGRRVWEKQAANTSQLTEPLDLTDHPAGMYLLRLQANGRTVSKKLLRQ